MRITGYGDRSEYLSFTLSIITRRCGHGRTSLPISHACDSGEVDSSTIFAIEEETAKKKKSTRDLFKTAKRSRWPFFDHRVKT